MKLYVASSWRNQQQPGIVEALRLAGFDVYDFKNPKEGDHGFHWKDVLLERDERGYCDPDALKLALARPRAIDGFASDFGAMKWADACVLVLPCGRSAHLEAGWMAGAGKPVVVYARGGEMIEPELMYGLLGPICTNLNQVVSHLRGPRTFPVLFEVSTRQALASYGCPREVPWSLVARHEMQAQHNHDQDLETLARRGGLAPCEMVAVLEDRPWHRMDLDLAVGRLKAAVETA